MTTFMQTITLEQWTVMKNNPRQRDTERHANRIEKHLQVPLPQHAVVHAAMLPDDTLVKLDGHTRGLLWDANRIPVPLTLSMIIYRVSGLDEAMRMYDTYDNAVAVESKADRVFGALRQLNVVVTSSILKGGRVATALETANVALGIRQFGSASDVNATVKEWVAEIRFLDLLITGHTSARLHSGILAAILLTLRRHGYGKVAPFWRKYMEPVEAGNVRDPHNVLIRSLRKRQHEKRTTGRDNTQDIIEKALSACEHALAGNDISHLKGQSLSRYLKAPPSEVTPVKHKGTGRRFPAHSKEDMREEHPHF